MPSKKAVVIGSGIAGMAAAIRLRMLGAEVQVFEKNTYPGGKLTAFSLGDYRFDAGPSLFTLPQLLDELIAMTGRKPDECFPYYRHPIACRYFWQDGTKLTAYGDAHAFGKEAERVLGVPARRIVAYLTHARRTYERVGHIFLQRSLHELSTWLSADVLRALSSLHTYHLLGSLHRFNQKKLQHPKLVQLFDRFATYNGSSPYLTPGIMHIIPHLEHGIGTFMPKQGMHAITQVLFSLAKDIGVSFHFGQQVGQILTDIHSRVKGVRVGKQVIEADWVVSNMDIVPTYRLLLADKPAPERILRYPRSSSAFIFYWGVRRKHPDLDLHNIFFSDDYRAEFEAIFSGHHPYKDPTIYINITSKLVPTDAPPDGENWFVMLNVPANTGQDWHMIGQQLRHIVLQKLSQQLGYPVESYIDVEDTLSPVDIEQKTASYQGSLYGASSNGIWSAFMRHPNFTNRIRGLYFVGGSVHPGGGIPLCLLSAKIVQQLIQKHYGIHTELVQTLADKS